MYHLLSEKLEALQSRRPDFKEAMVRCSLVGPTSKRRWCAAPRPQNQEPGSENRVAGSILLVALDVPGFGRRITKAT